MPSYTRSQTLVGFATGAPSGTFIPRSQRWVTFQATVDMGNLMTLGPRMSATFREFLVKHLAEAAGEIITQARRKLHVKPDDVVTPDGNIYGYDTGLMHDTLTAKLVNDAQLAFESVYYDLESDEAEYWVFVEFGHLLRNGAWWPGYYFLTSTVLENEAMIRQKVRLAWSDTVVALAAQARVSAVIPGPL